MKTKLITVKQNGGGHAATLAEAFALAQNTPAEYAVEIQIGAGTYK